MQSIGQSRRGAGELTCAGSFLLVAQGLQGYFGEPDDDCVFLHLEHLLQGRDRALGRADVVQLDRGQQPGDLGGSDRARVERHDGIDCQGPRGEQQGDPPAVSEADHPQPARFDERLRPEVVGAHLHILSALGRGSWPKP